VMRCWCGYLSGAQIENPDFMNLFFKFINFTEFKKMFTNFILKFNTLIVTEKLQSHVT